MRIASYGSGFWAEEEEAMSWLPAFTPLYFLTTDAMGPAGSSVSAMPSPPGVDPQTVA